MRISLNTSSSFTFDRRIRMPNIIINPGKYIQGRGEINNIAKYAGKLGDSSLILLSERGRKRFESIIAESFKQSGGAFYIHQFGGECTKQEIDNVRGTFLKSQCNAIIGIGGGKIIDTAKAVAHHENVPVMVVPTVASTDAPCSALSLLYKPNGKFDEFLFLRNNPDIVLVDSNIIASAPVRLFTAGMGDALATYVEASVSAENGGTTCAGGHATQAAIALSKLCYDILIRDGYAAKLAVSKGVCTKAVENVIEANIYLSGIGFESGGLCAAHAINNGFSALDECKQAYHGEIVTFGVLVQLVLENAHPNKVEEILCFCQKVGLPVTLSDLGLNADDLSIIERIAQVASGSDQMIHNMPFEVNIETVTAAIICADALGNAYKKRLVVG